VAVSCVVGASFHVCGVQNATVRCKGSSFLWRTLEVAHSVVESVHASAIRCIAGGVSIIKAGEGVDCKVKGILQVRCYEEGSAASTVKKGSASGMLP
jgi:hypothetical protein